MSRTLFKGFLVLAALCLAGCNINPVVTDYDPARDFSGLSTYAWLPETERKAVDPVVDSGLLGERVRAAVNQGLMAKAFREVAYDAKPSFLVTYHAAEDIRYDVDTFYGHYGYYPWWRHDRFGYGFGAETQVREYKAGTLVIDIIDPRDRKLMWRGQLERRVIEQATPEERTLRVNAAVAEILRNFPPGTVPVR